MLPGGSFSGNCDNFDNSNLHHFDDIATQMYIENESDTKESDTKESDTKESDTKESDTKESDTKESDTKESDTKESDTKESDTNESDTNESDTNESDTKESDTKESDVNTDTYYDSVDVSTDMNDDNDVSTSCKNVDVDDSTDGICTQMYHGPQTMLVEGNGIERAGSDIGTDNEATQMYCNAENQIHVANETDANNNETYGDVATQLYANNDNCYDDVSTQLYAIESTDPNKVSTQGYSNTLQDNHVLPGDNSNKVNDETISESVAPIDAELDVETFSKRTVLTEEPLVVVPIESTQKDEDVPVEICGNGELESTRASKIGRFPTEQLLFS